ncbi:hypothetical protein AAFF_G00113160 [Aldrovandia affinis]|uniref:Uncharacterized protein n=1 Tax=Aldrovandia affinis TaxID=143900 RepID=A0AAD7WAF0_9TELE|nr:hypothetical protein AAFF_G00113160 [Aldrovandia affinis]
MTVLPRKDANGGCVGPVPPRPALPRRRRGLQAGGWDLRVSESRPRSPSLPAEPDRTPAGHSVWSSGTRLLPYVTCPRRIKTLSSFKGLATQFRLSLEQAPTLFTGLPSLAYRHHPRLRAGPAVPGCGDTAVQWGSGLESHYRAERKHSSALDFRAC